MKDWIKEHKILSVILAIVIIGVVGMIIGAALEEDSSDITGNGINDQVKQIDLEMSLEEIFNMFSGLSEIQQEEKIKEFKGKRIKTSIYASEIDKASLSTQYVVKEMYDYPYSLSPYAKAFFPNEEKDNLLRVNIGDIIVFSGEFVTYHEGALTSYVEFTKSRFIEVK